MIIADKASISRLRTAVRNYIREGYKTLGVDPGAWEDAGIELQSAVLELLILLEETPE